MYIVVQYKTSIQRLWFEGEGGGEIKTIPTVTNDMTTRESMKDHVRIM